MAKMLSKEPTVHEDTRLSEATLGEWTEIGHHNVLSNVVVGDFSYSGAHCTFQNVVIGRFANIAAFVRVGATDHPMHRPTQHHFTYRRVMYGLAEDDDSEFFKQRQSRMTTIGHDTWLGHGALIKPDVTIGHGAVIGQGSVVTKDVPQYAIVVGNPARVIRYRFADQVVKALLRIKWWNWSHDQIKQHLDDFYLPIEVFVEKHDSD